MKNYKRILIIRLDRIGDVLLSTPAIQALRAAYPASYIACMVRPYAADVVRGNPHLNEIILYDKEGSEKSWWGTLRFAAKLRRQRFDVVVILHPTNRSHLVAFLAGIPDRVGYDRKLPWLLTRRVPHTKQFGLQHEIDYALGLVRAIGITAKNRKLFMPIRRESEIAVEAAFAHYGIQHTDAVITLHPGASCISKRWPAENFARVGDALAGRYHARIVIIAGKGDVTLAERMAAAMKSRPLNMAGITTVSEAASIIKRSRLFISNDSGPVHIACALGTPVIALFGRSDRGLSPKRWGPIGPHDAVLHKDVGCDPCYAHACTRNFICLTAITPEEVIQTADRILAAGKF